MTMPTNDERREVAARLRELADANRGLLGIERVQTVLYESQRVLGTLGLESVAHVIERHADLIEPEPERTCRAEVLLCREDDGSQSACLVCSECGEKLRYREAAADDGEPDYELLPHCAGCGARVEGAGE